MTDPDTRRNIGVPQWTMADRLRKIRRAAHLSQAEMGDILGVKAVTYGAWETGQNKPGDPLDVAQRIERHLGVPQTWTLGIPGFRRASDRGQYNRRATDMAAVS